MSISTLTLWESVVLDDQPTAYWGLDTADPLADDTGNGNTLTAVAAPANTTTLLPAGETGGATGARDFNGTTQAYTATDDPDLDLADTFTLELTVQFDSVAGTDTLLSKGTNAYQLRRNGTTLELWKEGTAAILATTGITLATATTYHVIAAKDGADGAFIYVNGVDRSGTVTNQTCSDTATSLHIGRKSDSTDYLDGRLDEVAVYKYAFTSSMVTGHYLAMSSGLFGNRVLGDSSRPALKVELALWSDPTDTYQRWEDLTDRMIACNGRRGRNFALDRMQTGSWQFEFLNRDRQLDPSFTTGDYYGLIDIDRRVRVRAQATLTSQTRPRFGGVVDGWELDYGTAGLDPRVRVSAAGMFKALSLDKIAGASPQPEELSGARLGTVVNIPGVAVTLGTGQSLVVGVDLDQANRLDHAQQVAETEAGVLFEAADGTLVFRDRHYRILNEATVRLTFGDGGGAMIPIANIDPKLDEDRLFTAATITPPSGVEQTAAASASGKFTRTKELSTLHAVDLDANAMANMFASRYSKTRTRIPSVRPLPDNPGAPAGAWDDVLALEISHRVATSVTPMGDASVVEREHFVEGIDESWRRDGGQVVFSVSPAELDSEYAVIGTAEIGDLVGATNATIGW